MPFIVLFLVRPVVPRLGAHLPICWSHPCIVRWLTHAFKLYRTMECTPAQRRTVGMEKLKSGHTCSTCSNLEDGLTEVLIRCDTSFLVRLEIAQMDTCTMLETPLDSSMILDDTPHVWLCFF